MPSPSKRPKPSSARPKPKKAPARKAPPPPKKKVSKAPVKKPAAPVKASKPVAAPAVKSGGSKGAAKAPVVVVEPLRGDERRHLLSLSFLRDGDEFLARLETDAGQITELKNRSLDQLLTLVAGELEDLLE